MFLNESFLISFVQSKKLFLFVISELGNVDWAISIRLHRYGLQKFVVLNDFFQALEVVQGRVQERCAVCAIILLRILVVSQLFWLLERVFLPTCKLTSLKWVINNSDGLSLAVSLAGWPLAVLNLVISSCTLTAHWDSELVTCISAISYFFNCGYWVFKTHEFLQAHL